MKNIIFILMTVACIFSSQATKSNSKNTQAHIESDIQLLYSVEQNSKTVAGNILIVGADFNGCHYDNIQDAIDDARINGVAEIRIATNKTYFENLLIDDFSVSLIGGYGNCQEAGLPFGLGSNQVLVDGGNSASVLKITGSSQRNTIVLKNLRLIEGLGQAPNADSTGGGILSYQANVRLSLKNVDVRSNDADYGAGIAIINGDTDMTLQNSRIQNNLASYGAGIYCAGGASSVVLSEDSGIIANVANGAPIGDADPSGKGAGLYVKACYFGIYSGSVTGGSMGISSNLAFSDGGGIYAESAATILINGHENCNASNCIGDDINPVNISGNIAGFSQASGHKGGGIFAKGGSTKVTVYAGLIENNSIGTSTNGTGGGIYISESELVIARLHQACWDKLRCNNFDGNIASSSGGGIYNNRGTVDISSSYFENNLALRGAAMSAIGFSNDNAFVRTESSIFSNNGNNSTESIFHGSSEITYDFIHNTIADNTASTAIFRMGVNGGGPNLAIHSTIIDNSGIDVLSHNMVNYAVNFSCIIANETDSLSESNNLINSSAGLAGGAFITQDTPAFIDRNNNDYHLSIDSPAIDYCNTPTHTTVLYKDIDFENRGWDDPTQVDNSIFSFFDIGADESYLSDIIFKNNFE